MLQPTRGYGIFVESRKAFSLNEIRHTCSSIFQSSLSSERGKRNEGCVLLKLFFRWRRPFEYRSQPAFASKRETSVSPQYAVIPNALDC